MTSRIDQFAGNLLNMRIPFLAHLTYRSDLSIMMTPRPYLLRGEECLIRKVSLIHQGGLRRQSAAQNGPEATLELAQALANQFAECGRPPNWLLDELISLGFSILRLDGRLVFSFAVGSPISGKGEAGPQYKVLDDHGIIYWPLGFASAFSGLSRKRLQQLTRDQRVKGVQAGGRDLFIARDDLIRYLEHGREKPGPKPGTKYGPRKR